MKVDKEIIRKKLMKMVGDVSYELFNHDLEKVRKIITEFALDLVEVLKL